MSASTSNIVCDSSTLTNFKAWAQAISSFFSTAGWTQSSDTGQVNWGTISAVPGSGAYMYEVWEPNDGLTNFYLKVEYGNFSGQTNCPTVRLTLGTATNGAGTLTGYVVGPFTTTLNSYTAPSTTVQYPCYFSGAPGRISIMMWRGGANRCPSVFSVERSINSSGAYTSSHVTLVTVGCNGGSASAYQQTLVFGVGVAPAQCQGSTSGRNGSFAVRAFEPNLGGSAAFNGSIPFDTIAPMVGQWDFPLTCLGTAPSSNLTEGQVFTTTLYGSTRTYVATASGDLPFSIYANSSVSQPLCMRYD